MSLAQTNAAVNEQRVVVQTGSVADRLAERERELVAAADDEAVERELRVELADHGLDRRLGGRGLSRRILGQLRQPRRREGVGRFVGPSGARLDGELEVVA